MTIASIRAFVTTWVAWKVGNKLEQAARPRPEKQFKYRPLFIVLILLARGLCAESDVTSREQFDRLLPGGLPNSLHYNIDRVSLELTADDQNCPVHSRGFFELKINSRGEVTKARDVRLSQSANLRTLAAGWVQNLLMQIHFRPLSLGNKTTSVHTFTTVVCQ